MPVLRSPFQAGPPFLRSDFDDPDGWVEGDYRAAWSEQVSFLVQT